jgi:hypothetical protein
MKTELEQKLLKKYPHFFDYIEGRKIYTGEKPMHEEVSELLEQKEIVLPIQFGFEVGDGWYVLLDELMSSITNHIKNHNKWNVSETIGPIDFKITQVKEKFGGLRFYGYGGDSVIEGMINFAENMSYRICETCGSMTGVGQTKGWIYTICWNCLQENERAKDMTWRPVGSEEPDEDELF